VITTKEQICGECFFEVEKNRLRNMITCDLKIKHWSPKGQNFYKGGLMSRDYVVINGEDCGYIEYQMSGSGLGYTVKLSENAKEVLQKLAEVGQRVINDLDDLITAIKYDVAPCFRA
jgi:hypothetical protein